MYDNPFVERATQAYLKGQVDAKTTANILVKAWTNPNDPANKLKKPTKRKCMYCQNKYKSEVSFLADDGFCSDECRAKADEQLKKAREELDKLSKQLNGDTSND